MVGTSKVAVTFSFSIAAITSSGLNIRTITLEPPPINDANIPAPLAR
jgi:hypothetical protein